MKRSSVQLNQKCRIQSRQHSCLEEMCNSSMPPRASIITPAIGQKKSSGLQSRQEQLNYSVVSMADGAGPSLNCRGVRSS